MRLGLRGISALGAVGLALVMVGCSEPETQETAPSPDPVTVPAPPAAAPTGPATATDLSPTDPANQPVVAALDAAVARSLGVPAKVNVEILRGEGDWAFVSGPALTPEGGEIDFSKTQMARAAKDGFMDGSNVIALLKRTEGAWAVAEMHIGPTDVPQVAWPRQYGVSPALVGQEEAEGGE